MVVIDFAQNLKSHIFTSVLSYGALLHFRLLNHEIENFIILIILRHLSIFCYKRILGVCSSKISKQRTSDNVYIGNF